MATFNRAASLKATLDRGYQAYRGLRELIRPPLNKTDIQKYSTFVLKRINPTVGVGSNIQLYCGAIDFIRRTVPGAKVVIDLQTFPNTLLETDELGKTNGWERLFHQPDHIGLDVATEGNEAISHKPTTLIVDNLEPFDRVWYRDLPKDSISGIRINKWRQVYQDNFQIRDAIKHDVDLFFEERFEPSDRILAVLCRGTDYVAQRPFGHPIQPPIETIFDEVSKTLEHYPIDKIFLSTEDDGIAKSFRSRFANVVEFPGTSVQFKKDKLLYQSFESGEKFKIAARYLKQIETISRRHHFIAGRCGGSLWAALHSPETQFDYVKIWDIGVYR
jgi:hypothetical protein